MTDDAEASAYLAGRGIDPVRVADLDAARALPLDVRPSWTVHRPDEDRPAAPWADTGHRLLVPMFDASAVMRNVRARYLGAGPCGRKGSARGSVAGLVFACPLARQVLERGARPSWWTDDAPAFRVIVAEGEIDFLTWATEASDANEHAPAVIGIVSGSWTAELAARIPDGAEVVVRTHADRGGVEYATKVLETLAPRIAARRVVVRLAPHFAAVLEGGRTIVHVREAET